MSLRPGRIQPVLPPGGFNTAAPLRCGNSDPVSASAVLPPRRQQHGDPCGAANSHGPGLGFSGHAARLQRPAACSAATLRPVWLASALPRLQRMRRLRPDFNRCCVTSTGATASASAVQELRRLQRYAATSA
ncbi:hypothetical protein CYMTET_36977 [Cymbomonas tetramitiformis]|uniref:Uncharacterized protein n=1 Tax=Cymbomonas tetramitiformis TaxID=36881 RepID=A0AAE0CGG1_9CHLO|nr:hypothetical protein CYMTET_36977 [Cymbomonas tetramitiformis]